MDKEIISSLLDLLSLAFSNGIYKDFELFQDIPEIGGFQSRYMLCIKGERDKGTPFYQGSIFTHIVREDYYNNELVYAEIIYEEMRNK